MPSHTRDERLVPLIKGVVVRTYIPILHRSPYLTQPVSDTSYSVAMIDLGFYPQTVPAFPAIVRKPECRCPELRG